MAQCRERVRVWALALVVCVGYVAALTKLFTLPLALIETERFTFPFDIIDRLQIIWTSVKQFPLRHSGFQ